MTWRRSRLATLLALTCLVTSCGLLDSVSDDEATDTLPPLAAGAGRDDVTGNGTSAHPPPSAPLATPVVHPPSSTAVSAPTTSQTPPTPPPTTTAATTTTTTPATTTERLDLSVPPEVDAASYAIFDATSRRWVGEHDADAPRSVGSVMKLLTAYTVMQAGDPGRQVTVPAAALGGSEDESRIWLYEGQQLSRDVLLRATLVASANDAARTLAIDIAGSESAFADRMNANAAGLGLQATVAANPTGLDAPGARSTARDVTLLAATLMQEATFRETARMRSVEMFGQDFPSTNIALLDSYAGAAGIKTGHTSDAGYCVAAAAERDGRLLIVAVLGAPTSEARLDAATALLDWGFRQS